MAIETIKLGGFVGEEVAKVNANFTEIETNYAKKDEIPSKTSELTNDSGFITSSDVPTSPTKLSQLQNDAGYVKTTDTAFTNKVDKDGNKVLSDNNYTTTEKNKLNNLRVPEMMVFTEDAWSNGTITLNVEDMIPIMVMRENGSSFETALVDIRDDGTNVVITADEPFDGYILLI